MLAFLALSPGAAADRGKIAGLLWSEGAEAKVSLRQCIKEVRQAFAVVGLPVLAADRFRVALDVGALWVDVLELQRLARSGRRDDLEEMADLYTGDLLDDLRVSDQAFEEWLAIERARIRERVCHALKQGLARCRDDADEEGLVHLAEALVRIEPSHEGAHRALIRHYGERGDLAAAIRQYQACRAALARELDLAPAAETEALVADLRRGALSRRIAHPPPHPVAVPRPRRARTTLTIEPKALALGGLADQALATAVAAALREALTRVRWLEVIDPGLWLPAGLRVGFTPAAALPPHYGVYVSVLRAGERVRLSAELKEAESARILWVQHYDRALDEDVFGLVDDFALALAASLDREVRLAEMMRAARQPAEALGPYDRILKAIPAIFTMTPDSFAEAERLLLQAQQDDPHEPMVYAWRAFLAFLQIGQGWVHDTESAESEIRWLVRRAIELDPKNPFALAIAGHVASFVHHDYEQALGHFERSLRLDPNSLYALDLSAITQCYTGNAAGALRQLDRCSEAWQYDPYRYFFLATACITHMFAGQYELAAQIGRRTIRENPNFQAAYRPLIASLGHLGRIDEARTHLTTLRRAEPDFSIDWFRARYPPLQKGDAERYVEGLRKAGVPEE
jgi:DNA-binding SARP family transcriptional activator